MIGRMSPCASTSFLRLLALLLLASVAPLAAATALTNGHPIVLSLPEIEEERTLLAGDDSFTIFVPEGATRLVVEFVTSPEALVELAVEFGQDVGTDGGGNFLADFREKPNPRGVARIEIDKVQFPRLKDGTYFIAFYFSVPTGPIQGELTATVSGPLIDPVQPIAESTFDEDLEGWTRNDTESPYPGTNVGDDRATIEFVASGGNTGGDPDGHARMRTTRNRAEDWFVAPDEFLVDFLALNEPRLTFDLTILTAFKEGNFFVEARLFGKDGAWRWVAPSGPPDPDGNWVSCSITMREEFWRVFEGNFMAFEQVFSNPKRLEIRASYNALGNRTSLDNVRLFVRGDIATPVLPAITSFSAGIDGWSRNYPASEQIALGTEGDKNAQLIWNEFEGNPEGFLRIVENGGSAPDAFVVPDLYLGNYHGLEAPRLEFDYRHTSLSGSTKPVEILLIGTDTAFRWTGVLPGDVWSRQIAFLDESAWTRVEGDRSFFSTLGFVKRIEIGADLAEGEELNSIDNFALLTADTPPVVQSISALPSSLTFAGVATGPNPDGATLDITASNGDLRWEATVEGSLADRISLSAVEGDTPSEVSVQIDTQGVPAGIGEAATITFTAVGVTTDTALVPVTLILGDQPNPTPEIFDGGIVNSASYTPTFAGGVLGSIFGRFLGGPEEGVPASFIGRNNDTLPAHINGVRVLVFTPEGLLLSEAPLTYLGDNQINFQLPFAAAGMGLVKIAVDNSGARSEMQSIPVTNAAPGIFTDDSGRAVVTDQHGDFITPNNPADRNSIVTVYMTGQGPVAPMLASGQAATAIPLIRAPLDVSVQIAGHGSEIQFLGMTPGLVGVLQLNVRPSFFTPSGDQSLLVTVGGHESNIATIAME